MGKYANMFKGAAVTGAGLSIGMLPQMLLGACILLVGFVLFTNESKKSKSRQNKVKLFGGIGLMLLGAVIGWGTCLGVALKDLATQL